ncbi:LOW QUALITY PROTEIN: hypothetical protein CVT25_013637, partial [Psilocybe cyanescens]
YDPLYKPLVTIGLHLYCIWKVTPARLKNLANNLGYKDDKHKFKNYMILAKEKKEAGNKAFAAKNSEAAISTYKEATKYLDMVCHYFTPGDDTMKQEETKLQIICYANCSVIVRGNASPESAEKLLKMLKPYVCLSQAHQALGKFSEAEEAIARALHLQQMESDKGLVDHLISIQMCGKGLPEVHPENFKDWMKYTFSDGSARAE